MEKKKFTCEHCGKTVMLPPIKTRKYCSKACYYEASLVKKGNTHHKDDPHRKTCQVCRNLITKYRFSNACSPECREKLNARDLEQAQKKPCRQCGGVITRPKNYRYCSDQCRYDAWLAGKRKRPRNTNCRQCDGIITDNRKTVYCTTECRLKYIQEAYDAKHDEEKKCKKCKVILVNNRRKYCTADCRRVFNVIQQRKSEAEQAERNRANRNGENSVEQRVAKIQREAKERRAALRG